MGNVSAPSGNRAFGTREALATALELNMTQLDLPGVAQVMLTTKQLAERWGVSAGSLANDRFLGRSSVPYVKIGERVRYRLEDVLEFEAGARHDGRASRSR